MFNEMEEEFERLKEILEKKQMLKDKSNNFFDENDYEGDFSHDEISEFQGKFTKNVEKYLKEHYTGQYVMFCDWCVHVVTIEFYRNVLKPIPDRDMGIYC